MVESDPKASKDKIAGFLVVIFVLNLLFKQC